MEVLDQTITPTQASQADASPVPTCTAPNGPTSFWRLVDLLSQIDPKIPPGDQHPSLTSVLPFTEYSEEILGAVEHFLTLTSTQTQDRWRDLLCFNRRDDLRYAIIPAINANLRNYAAEGQAVEIYRAVANLIFFLVREELRAGNLPVMASVYDIHPADPKENTLQ